MRPLLLLVVLLFPSAAFGGTEYRTLTDDDRGRDVPVKLHLPEGDRPEDGWPVVVFSHGLGGSREVAPGLCTALAERGYVVAAVQHPGSDESVWRDLPRRERAAALREAANAEQSAARARDVSFVLDTLLADADLGLDEGRVAVAGHSFGARTTLLVSGARTVTPGLKDDRIRAAIAISSQPVRNAAELDAIDVPILHVTGTDDASPLKPDLKPEDRQGAYHAISAAGQAGQFLIVFDAATHSTFVGTPRRREGVPAEVVAHVQAALAEAAGRFLDVYLAPEPGGTLDPAALREVVGPDDVVEPE